jgi:hypothetical protein
VLTVQLSVQNHCSRTCSGKGVVIWFSVGRLGQRYIADIVKYFVQRHVFAQSPPGWRPSDKYPVNTSHRSWFVYKRLTRGVVW